MDSPRPLRPGGGPAVRRLGPADAAAFRDLRLEGLAAHPEAFEASWAEESARPLAWFEGLLERNAVFGAGAADAGGRDGLAGAAGLLVPDAAEPRREGVLWGLYVRPAARRTGLAAALVARVLEHARVSVGEVRLSVNAANAAAIRLYEAAGFARCGLERRAPDAAGRCREEALMVVRLNGGSSPGEG